MFMQPFAPTGAFAKAGEASWSLIALAEDV